MGKWGARCLLAVMACVSIAAGSESNVYLPAIQRSVDGTWDLYVMKLDASGGLVRGPRLVRNSDGYIISSDVVSQGNRIVFTEQPVGSDEGQVYAIRINPNSLRPIGGPAAVTSGGGYAYYGVGVSKDGRKVVTARYSVPGTDSTICLMKLKKNSVAAPGLIPISPTVPNLYFPFITSDGRSAYYCAGYGANTAVWMQSLSASGSPTGSPAVAQSLPGENVLIPRTDAGRKFMTFFRSGDSNLYIVPLSPSGMTGGVAVPVTSVGPGTYAFGGILPNGRAVIYTVTNFTTTTMYSQALDSTGLPVGSPVVLIPPSTLLIFPWLAVG